METEVQVQGFESNRFRHHRRPSKFDVKVYGREEFWKLDWSFSGTKITD